MTRVLVVPSCLDALVLDEPTAVMEAFSDFSRLPYFDSVFGRQIDTDVPYLSEDILSELLEDEGHYLPAGIQLLWTLPYALTCAVQTWEGSHWLGESISLAISCLS